ncbi:MAG: hypothetical protein IKF17_00245 [Clostridia bacterium]|nr:hypothetical protein [Clostridia bacterium]
MRVFYGGIYLEKKTLQEAGIEHPIKLEYYKIINTEEKIYGIDIVKTEYKTNNMIKEEKELKEISKDELKIEKMLNIFKSCAVTPITAQEVVEDLLKQTF